MIRVASVERVGGALSIPVGPAASPVSARTGYVVTLVDDRGRIGVGEASPFPGLSRETDLDARDALAAAGAVLADERVACSGAESMTPVDASWLVAQIDLALEARADKGRTKTALPASARFALETALADLAARTQGVSVAEWLSLGDGHRRVARSVLVGPLDGPDLIAAAKKAISRGARTLKLKVRGDRPAEEVEAILSLRRAVAESDQPLRIRLDPNGALDVRGAREALEAYALADIELCEEPVRGPALLRLGPCSTPWLADESLIDGGLVSALLLDQACAGFVVKPELLGLFGARAISLAAMAAGKHVVVTHTLDGPIALAAACELALSLPAGPYAAGLDLHAALDAYPTVSVPQLSARSDGELVVEPSGGVGLGIVWSEAP